MATSLPSIGGPVAQTANIESPFSPIGEQDNRCDGPTTDPFSEENESQENIPPDRAYCLFAAISTRTFLPYLGGLPPEVYLDFFIPPEIRF